MKNHLFLVTRKVMLALLFSSTIMWLPSSPVTAWGQATQVDIATDATDPNNLDDSEPSIAVNPVSGQISVVSFSETWGPSSRAPVWKSDDGGLTWRKVFQIPQPAPGLSGPADQKIAYDASGSIFVTELGLFPVTDFIFRQIGLPDDPLTPGQGYGDDQPHLDIDKLSSACPNILYSPWLNTSPFNFLSMVARSADAGVTMASVAVGDNSSFPDRTTRIALGPDGKAYVIYKTREGAVDANFENAHFYARRSDDCGVSWDAISTLPGIPVHGAAAVITWFTNNFGNPAKGKVARARSSDAWIAVDPVTSDVYAAYVSRDASGFGQIYVARSIDQGVTWKSGVRVSDGTHHSAYPEIAVAHTSDNKVNAVGVLYVDYDDSGPHNIYSHRFARSFDMGGTWNNELLQSFDPFDLPNARDHFLWGDYEGLTAQADTFFGVYSGQSSGRTVVQMDPIFFTERGVP